MNKVGMNLAKHDQWPGTAFAGCAELLQKFLSILFDRGPRVLLSESKIQGPSSVDGGESAWTRAEAVDEPGNRLERVSLENLELSFPGSLHGHCIILAMSVTSGTHGRPTNDSHDVAVMGVHSYLSFRSAAVSREESAVLLKEKQIPRR